MGVVVYVVDGGIGEVARAVASVAVVAYERARIAVACCPAGATAVAVGWAVVDVYVVDAHDGVVVVVVVVADGVAIVVVDKGASVDVLVVVVVVVVVVDAPPPSLPASPAGVVMVVSVVALW